MDFKDKLKEKLHQKFPSVEFSFEEFRGELTIKFDKNVVIEVADYLKTDEELSFKLCEDVTGIDWQRKKNRFTLVYQLFSLNNKFRLRIKCDLGDEWSIESVTSVWRSSNWAERETYDMYGITFNNHPDLRRMYMPEEFEYYPLRKDFPLMGVPGSIPLPKK